MKNVTLLHQQTSQTRNLEEFKKENANNNQLSRAKTSTNEFLQFQLNDTEKDHLPSKQN